MLISRPPTRCCPPAGIEHVRGSAPTPASSISSAIRSSARFRTRACWSCATARRIAEESLRKFLDSWTVRSRDDSIATIDTWEANWPREQFRVLFYDDIQNRPYEVLEDVCRFVGLPFDRRVFPRRREAASIRGPRFPKRKRYGRCCASASRRSWPSSPTAIPSPAARWGKPDPHRQARLRRTPRMRLFNIRKTERIERRSPSSPRSAGGGCAADNRTLVASDNASMNGIGFRPRRGSADGCDPSPSAAQRLRRHDVGMGADLPAASRRRNSAPRRRPAGGRLGGARDPPRSAANGARRPDDDAGRRRGRPLRHPDARCRRRARSARRADDVASRRARRRRPRHRPGAARHALQYRRRHHASVAPALQCRRLCRRRRRRRHGAGARAFHHAAQHLGRHLQVDAELAALELAHHQLQRATRRDWC